MSDVDNRQRAEGYLKILHRYGDPAAELESWLNQAEDRGGERAALLGEPDAVTVDALRSVIWNLLNVVSLAHISMACINDRANAITQAIIGLFYVRLREEGDEATEPERPAP